MAQKTYILEILPNCIIGGFNCSHLAYCMHYNKSYYMHTCQRIETACEAKHPLRNFIFYAIFHSVDSIFCLITTFPFLPFYLLYDETCSWKIYRRDLHMPIPLIGLPSLVLRKKKKEWKQYQAALSESQFLLLTNAFHLRHASGRGYQSLNGLHLNLSIHSIKQKEGESKGGRWIFKEL